MESYLAMSSAAPPEWVRVPFSLPAYLTLRQAGDMRRDGTARTRFYQRVGLDPGRIHVVGQVHSRRVVVAPRETGGGERTAAGENFIADADGIITNDPSLTLAVTVADCMPIFVSDTESHARGLLHSGWKGTGILGRAMDLLKTEFGCLSANLVVTMGPCISVESYEVDEDRAASFASDWGPGAVQEINGRPHLDLRAANQEICRRSGVDLVNVVSHCTFQDSRFGSFRRQGPEDYSLMLALLTGTVELETVRS